MIQNIAKSKKTNKSKRPKDEEYTKNKICRKQPPPKKNGSHGKINRTVTFHGKRLCKIVFRGHSFVRHLGICNGFLSHCYALMRAVIEHNSVKQKRSLYINKWPSYSWLQCFTSAILSAILQFVTWFVSNLYNWCVLSLYTISWKNEVSTLINGRATVNYSVSRPPFRPPSWNL